MDKALTITLNFPQSTVSAHSSTSEKISSPALWDVELGMLPTAPHGAESGIQIMGPKEEQTQVA